MAMIDTSRITDLANPGHYRRWKIEPLQFIMENDIPFVPANVIKYVMRYDDKDGLNDLIKARSYLDRLIAQQEGKAEYWLA